MLLSILLGSGGGGLVTLSGEVITDTFAGVARALIEIRSNGNVFKDEGGVLAQIDSGTDWLRPSAFAPDDYEVRFVDVSGDPAQASTASGVWIDLTSNFSVGYATAGGGPETLSGTFNIEIRKGNSGPALVSALYDATAIEL